MTAPGALPRRRLVQLLRSFGYAGPGSGAKHRLMRRGARTVARPNPHGYKDVPWWLVREILSQAGIDEGEAQAALGSFTLVSGKKPL